MSGDLRIEGGDALLSLSKAVKQVGDKELRAELSKAIGAATKPMVTDIQASVMSIPSRGKGHRGTRAKIAKAVRKQQKLGKDAAGISIVVATSLDRGRRAVAFAWEQKGEVVGRVFGQPGTHVTVPGRRDWFRGPAGKRGPQVRAALEQAMAGVAAKIEKILR